MPSHQASVSPEAALPFTAGAKAALRVAYAQAAEEDAQQTLRPEHVLVGLAEAPESLAGAALNDLGVSAETVRLTLGLPALSPESRARASCARTIWERPPLAALLGRARTLAQGQSSIGTAHLLLAILDHEGDEGRHLLTLLGVSLPKLRRAAEDSLEPPAAAAARGQLPFTFNAREALQLAHAEATRQDADVITAPFLLLGLATTPSGTAKSILTRDFGVDADTLRAAL
jgi:ATP-dependent Clp protease ATP-binding subunit ClpA